MVKLMADSLRSRCSRVMQPGKSQPEEALRIVPQICDALPFAHQHGVVHRDIEPEPDRRCQTVEEMRGDAGGVSARPSPDPGRQLDRQRQRDRQLGRREVRASQTVTISAVLVAAGLLEMAVALMTGSELPLCILIPELAAPSVMGFPALATPTPGELRGPRLAAAVASAWFPILLVINVMVTGLVQALLPDASEDTSRTIAAWLWGSMLLADLAVLAPNTRRLSRRVPAQPPRLPV